ncbi:hypothetical protein [Halorussus aquaticus]|uniref:Uncharacterized protein n=1 Tax=Halorussus aquaticus TaxID=2953748 RepID=A0ABD5Q152_9EURY|nr:hypothetical protein [Halorussus aquaticus]
MTGFLHRALGVFVRLFGAAVAVVGAFVAASSPEAGVPLFLFGVAFALRPHLSGKAADWAKLLLD